MPRRTNGREHCRDVQTNRPRETLPSFSNHQLVLSNSIAVPALCVHKLIADRIQHFAATVSVHRHWFTLLLPFQYIATVSLCCYNFSTSPLVHSVAAVLLHRYWFTLLLPFYYIVTGSLCCYRISTSSLVTLLLPFQYIVTG